MIQGNAVIDRLKENWARLRSDPPGERFERRYERRQEEETSSLRRWGYIGAGILVLAGGIFLLPAPGPGMLVVAMGVALIAQEARPVARALDWTELKVRPIVEWALGVYRRASTLGRVMLVVLVVLVLAAAAYGAYRLLF